MASFPFGSSKLNGVMMPPAPPRGTLTKSAHPPSDKDFSLVRVANGDGSDFVNSGGGTDAILYGPDGTVNGREAPNPQQGSPQVGERPGLLVLPSAPDPGEARATQRFASFPYPFWLQNWYVRTMRALSSPA